MTSELVVTPTNVVLGSTCFDLVCDAKTRRYVWRSRFDFNTVDCMFTVSRHLNDVGFSKHELKKICKCSRGRFKYKTKDIYFEKRQDAFEFIYIICMICDITKRIKADRTVFLPILINELVHLDPFIRVKEQSSTGDGRIAYVIRHRTTKQRYDYIQIKFAEKEISKYSTPEIGTAFTTKVPIIRSIY